MKVYVPVLVDYDINGNARPLVITWQDGRKYKIDRVTEVRLGTASPTGGSGDRYTILIQGRVRKLYFERKTNLTAHTIGRWYVEGKENAIFRTMTEKPKGEACYENQQSDQGRAIRGD